jgi:hypothetical protein
VLSNSENWFRKATRENDVHNWAPKSSVKLLHCMGDDVIPFSISQLAEGTMKAMGATDVSLVPVEVAVSKDLQTKLRYKHAECGPVAYSVATEIFAQVRKTIVGY